jgi:hypothetical protein
MITDGRFTVHKDHEDVFFSTQSPIGPVQKFTLIQSSHFLKPGYDGEDRPKAKSSWFIHEKLTQTSRVTNQAG